MYKNTSGPTLCSNLLLQYFRLGVAARLNRHATHGVTLDTAPAAVCPEMAEEIVEASRVS